MGNPGKGGDDSVRAATVQESLLLSRGDVARLLTMDEALSAVERAFLLRAQGLTVMPAKVYLDLKDHRGDFRAMPAYVDGSAGVKWVSVYPDNPQARMLPTVMGLIILSDPVSSLPLAVMDGEYITSVRTGAAGGVAAKYLARSDSSVLGIIGAGRQARTQVRAVQLVLPRLVKVQVYDVNPDARRRFVDEMGAELPLDFRAAASVAEAASADVVITTTVATGPTLLREHVRPGTHINAIGADAPGKQELEGSILRDARVVVDDVEQASHSGEINVPISKGEFAIRDIHCTLGEIVAGSKQGREDRRVITVFDSTGLAIQDIACARAVFEKARHTGLHSFNFSR